jgi:SAM-dependent methyltransferase
MIYSDPATDPSLLAALYEKSLITYEAEEEQIYASYSVILDRALAGLRQRNAFVEVGGGRGFMLRYGHEKGFASQIEIEPSAEAERKFTPFSGGSRFIPGMFSNDILPAGTASLLCFFQVLDHIAEPRRFLENVFEALEPGGAAVCVTHDTSAWSARLLREHSPIFDIQHTYLFNPNNLAMLFRAAGFSEVETLPAANCYSIRYWLHLAPLPGPVKRGARVVLDWLRLAEKKVRLFAGNFATIARKGL